MTNPDFNKIFAGVGALGGVLTAVVGVLHLWPLIKPKEGYNTMLHVMTAYLLLPMGLVLALHDAHQAGVIGSPSKFVGSFFDSVLDFLGNNSRYVAVLLWAAFTTFGFDGGLFAFLLLFVRALTLIPPVRTQIDKGIDFVQEKRKGA